MVEAFVPIARVAELQRQTGIRAVALPPRPHPISAGGAPTNGAIPLASPGARHGTAVAEIVHEMAPDAQIYLATVGSPGDQMSAIDYFASQGVQVINQSLAWWYDGAGDGTGLSAGGGAYAGSQGIVWVKAAGNFAGGDY